MAMIWLNEPEYARNGRTRKREITAYQQHQQGMHGGNGMHGAEEKIKNAPILTAGAKCAILHQWVEIGPGVAGISRLVFDNKRTKQMQRAFFGVGWNMGETRFFGPYETADVARNCLRDEYAENGHDGFENVGIIGPVPIEYVLGFKPEEPKEPEAFAVFIVRDGAIDWGDVTPNYNDAVEAVDMALTHEATISAFIVPVLYQRDAS